MTIKTIECVSWKSFDEEISKRTVPYGTFITYCDDSYRVLKAEAYYETYFRKEVFINEVSGMMFTELPPKTGYIKKAEYFICNGFLLKFDDFQSCLRAFKKYELLRTINSYEDMMAMLRILE